MKRLYLSICFIVLLLPFAVNGLSFSLPATVTVNPLPSFTIFLNQGWNLISIPLILNDTNIEVVLAEIMDYVIVVNGFESGSDGGARTYSPLLPPMFSDLEKIDHLHGYWIKVTEEVDLSVSGTEPGDKTINLDRGWNLISYLCDSPRNVTDVFRNIMGKVIVINGFEKGALMYSPDLPTFSNLKVMKPGLGYWVKMGNPAMLNYGKVC